MIYLSIGICRYRPKAMPLRGEKRRNASQRRLATKEDTAATAVIAATAATHVEEMYTHQFQNQSLAVANDIALPRSLRGYSSEIKIQAPNCATESNETRVCRDRRVSSKTLRIIIPPSFGRLCPPTAFPAASQSRSSSVVAPGEHLCTSNASKRRISSTI